MLGPGEFARIDDGAGNGSAMAAHVFGQCVNDNIRTVLEWTAQCRRRYSIVYNKRHAMAMGCIGDCLDVHDVARRVAYGFAEYRFGVFVDKRFQGGHIVVRGELDRNALARKGMRTQVVSAGERKE